MAIDFIISTINTLLAGRKIVGGVSVLRSPTGSHEVWAFVLNSDGIGKRDTLLADLPDLQQAITVQRTLSFAQ